MADTSRTLRVIFDGSVQGLKVAAAQARASLAGLDGDSRSLSRTLGGEATRAATSLASGFVKLGATASAVQGTTGAVAGLGAAVSTLAPAALALPAVMLGAAAAVATFKLATSGVGDAVAGDAEAMAKLAPSAREFATSVQALKPALDGVRQAAQQAFFEGFAEHVRALGEDYMPVLATQLPNIARGFNGIGVQALYAAQTPFFRASVGQILDNTATSLENMRPALGQVLTGFVGLGNVGSKLLPGLGASVDDVTASFAGWVETGVADGSIERMIDDAIDGFQSLGRTVGNFSATGRNALGAFADGLGGGQGSALGRLEAFSERLEQLSEDASVQAGFRALGETVGRVGDAFQRVLEAGIRELAPIVVELGPVVSEVADEMADWAVDMIQQVGPALRATAGFLGDHKEVIGDLVPVLLSAAVAYKGLQVATTAAGWVSALGLKITDTADRAEKGKGKLDGFAGGLKAVGIAAGLIALGEIGKAIDDANIAAAGGVENLGAFESQLHKTRIAMESLVRLDFTGLFDQAKAELLDYYHQGQIIGAKIRGLFANVKIEPLTFEVNTGPSKAQVDQFISQVNSSTPTVNINGNTNGAAFAYRTILQEMANGKTEIMIDGNTMPIEEAREYVLALITAANPEMTINGNTVPMEQALALALGKANSSTSTSAHGVDASLFRDGVGAALADANRGKSTSTHDANTAPATGKVGDFMRWGNAQVTRPKVEVDTSSAAARLSAFLSTPRTITVRTNVVTNGTVQGRALGAYAVPGAAYMAFGGLRSMSAARAEIVPPNQPRIIGDRMIDDEAFIPINDSARSHRILALAAERMGYRLMANGGLLGSGAGRGDDVPTLLRTLIAAVHASSGDTVVQLDREVVARVARREIARSSRDIAAQVDAGMAVYG